MHQPEVVRMIHFKQGKGKKRPFGWVLQGSGKIRWGCRVLGER